MCKIKIKILCVIFLQILISLFFVADLAYADSPIGYFDNIRSDGTSSGWALDPDVPNQSINVHFYLDGSAGVGTFIGSALADFPRPDVNNVTGYPGNHGFNYYIPYEYRDNKTHTLYAYGIDATGDPNFHLIWSPRNFKIQPPSVFYPNKGKLWMSPNLLVSLDVKKLFTESDKWKKARSYVSVFQMADWQIHRMLWGTSLLYPPFNLTPEQIFKENEFQDLLTKLKLWGIDFSLESGAVKEWGCTADKTFPVTKAVIEKTKSLGGKVKYIFMDEPLVHMRPVPSGCGYTMEQVAEQTLSYINLIKNLDSTIIIGDVEPWPHFSKETLKQWIIKFKEKSGYEFPFFYLDVNYAQVKVDNKNIYEIKEIGDFCRARGIQFGMIIWQSNYNYPASLDSDETFYKNSMAWADITHSVGPFDKVIVQSWDPYPKYNLPDSSGYSLTQLVKDYATKYPPAILPISLPDLNQDGKVNSVDLGIFLSYWNSTAKPKADINQDGIVNSVDFGIMMSEWSL